MFVLVCLFLSLSACLLKRFLVFEPSSAADSVYINMYNRCCTQLGLKNSSAHSHLKHNKTLYLLFYCQDLMDRLLKLATSLQMALVYFTIQISKIVEKNAINVREVFLSL